MKNQKKISSQNAAILRALQDGRVLTPMAALREFSCMRLGARIFNLRRRGWRIKSELVLTRTGKRVACYSLMPEDE